MVNIQIENRKQKTENEMTQQTGENGSLRVTIVEARQLKDRDLIDDDDPYVELYLDKQTKRRTSTVQESNNPIWNETFTFPLNKHQDHLHIRVYDDDETHRRDSIGSAKINLKKHVFGKSPYDEWVKLPTMMGLNSHGRVHLIVQHLP